MRVLNEHSRQIETSSEAVGALIDALLEDGLDQAESGLMGREWIHRSWPWTVRTLRRLLARR